MNDRGPGGLRIGGKFDEFVPLQMVERRLGETVLSVLFVDHHLNAAGMVHGGFISAALDVALAAAAASDPNDPRSLYGITLSLTVNFIAPVPAGRVFCHARVSGGGKTTKFVDGVMGPVHPATPDSPRYATATATLRVVVLDD